MYKLMGSLLGPNSFITKAVKMYLLLLCQMCNIHSVNRINALAPNRRNSLPCKIRTFRQRLCNYRKVCSVVRISKGDGSENMHKVCGSGLLLWSGWLISSSTTPSHRNITKCFMIKTLLYIFYFYLSLLLFISVFLTPD